MEMGASILQEMPGHKMEEDTLHIMEHNLELK